jgi:hypothetical protein
VLANLGENSISVTELYFDYLHTCPTPRPIGLSPTKPWPPRHPSKRFHPFFDHREVAERREAKYTRNPALVKRVCDNHKAKAIIARRANASLDRTWVWYLKKRSTFFRTTEGAAALQAFATSQLEEETQEAARILHVRELFKKNKKDRESGLFDYQPSTPTK